ncbi:MAG: VCBS repeat-containing protein [Acidobacteria bacterium]|nr:VCBS repeat-containing protein [Acidobacteriota bacterium]
MARQHWGLIAVAALAAAAPIALQGQVNGRFSPDARFTATTVNGLQQIGAATWRIEKGEIVGTPTSPDGGWLVLDRGYQDVQFAASFRCAGDCTAGVMVRSEKGASGLQGLYSVLAGGERGAMAVAVDAQGRITSRTPLTGSINTIRIAPPPAPAPAARAGGGGRAGAPGGAAPPPFVSMFPPTPSSDFRPNDWNKVEIILEADVLRLAVNAPGSVNGVATSGSSGFGPIALHVAGTGEVRFKDLELKDLNRRITPPETVSPRFRAQKIEDFYYGWSMAAGDFNHDGVLDVTAGNRYYLGPSFSESRELYLAQPFNPAKEYTPAMVNFAFDYTGDGWDDILVAESRAPALYVNPKGEARRWTRYAVFPQVISEVMSFKDVDGDKVPDAIYSGSGTVQWATSDKANPTGPWKAYAVSTPGPPGSSIHGVGAGDVNGDGRVDLIAPHGWWEQPAGGATQTPWTFHQAAFGRAGNAGGEFEVWDVNGDKLPDIVTALAAHGFGLAWYEQKRDAAGKITWVEHVIMNDFASKNAGGVTFSELHALTAADIDGDGIKDIVTGKRHWAHLESTYDPDAYSPAVLYWYRTVRNPKAPGGAEFVPELIHNRSGVGSMISTADLNRDGAADVMAATNRGNYIFWGRPGTGRRGAAPPAAPPARGRQ